MRKDSHTRCVTETQFTYPVWGIYWSNFDFYRRVRITFLLLLVLFPSKVEGNAAQVRSYLRLLAGATCTRIMGLFEQGKTHIGYQGEIWTPELFQKILQEGIYAPLVHTIAKNEGIPLKEAYGRVKFLDNAPNEVITWLMGRHVGSHNSNTPFISSSANFAIAHSYAQSPGARTLFQLAFSGHSGKPGVLFSIDNPNAFNPLEALNQQRNGAISPRDILVETGTVNSHERKNRIEEIKHWLEAHDWLNILNLHDHKYIFSVEKDSYYGKKGKKFPNDSEELKRNFLNDFSDLFSELRGYERYAHLDREREYLLWIPPNKIKNAKLYDKNGRLLRELAGAKSEIDP